MNYDKCEKINLQKLSWLITLIFSFYFAKFLSPNIFFRYLRIENWFIVNENVEFIVVLCRFLFENKMNVICSSHIGNKKALRQYLIRQAYHKFCIVYAYECTKYKDVIFIATETFCLWAKVNCWNELQFLVKKSLHWIYSIY